MNPAFALSNSGNITVAPGATTGNSSIVSVTGSGGFAGAVALTCAVTPAAASDPAVCSLSAASVTISGATAQTSTLTITTTAATTARVDPKAGGVGWYATAGATLACVLLCGIPGRRRGWQSLFGMLILLACMSTLLVSCGGGGGGGGSSSTSNPGTTAGTYTVTVTGTSGSTAETSYCHSHRELKRLPFGVLLAGGGWMRCSLWYLDRDVLQGEPEFFKRAGHAIEGTSTRPRGQDGAVFSPSIAEGRR